ncbi:MAG TPA: universal stress protein [Acidimicrobiales bacterium]|nr:universal stress protein [Acidimicrobiales bacterium]
MWERLLLALDQFEPGEGALAFTAGIAREYGSHVHVLHLRELHGMARVQPLETVEEADRVVQHAARTLAGVGVRAEGRSLSVPRDHVARCIVEESAWRECDAIVLGSRRLVGIDRLSGRGTRERVLRLSFVPVLVAPAPAAASEARGAVRGRPDFSDYSGRDRGHPRRWGPL